LGVFDGPHATPKKTDDGPVFLGISSLSNGRLDLSMSEHLSEEDFRHWTRRVTPQPGDIVFSYETRLGEAAIIPDGIRCCLGRRLALMRPDSEVVDSRFLLYAYLGPYFQEIIRSRTIHGSTVDRISLIDFPSFPIRVPELPEQRAIAHVLGTLDDKIELNRRMNRTLEEIARALFTAWFVDFEPVRAKAAGREPAGMDAETAALFPSEFEESELGEIPKGWSVATLGDLAINRRQQVDPTTVDAQTPYIGLEHMPRRSIALDEWGTAANVESGKTRFTEGEILFGKLRPYFHKVGMAPVSGICSTDILVLRPKREEMSCIVLMHASSDRFVQFADAGSHGTRMPRASWDRLERYPVCWPPLAVSMRLEELVRPMLCRIHANIFETRTLTAIRDTLLPRLLSGEVRVAEAGVVGEVGVAVGG